jgi:hypothetical protein
MRRDLNHDVKIFYAQAISKGLYSKIPHITSLLYFDFLTDNFMSIVSEITECHKAVKSKNIDSDMLWSFDENNYEYESEAAFNISYEENINGTLAERLANVYIKICELSGATNTILEEIMFDAFVSHSYPYLNVEGLLRLLTQTIMDASEDLVYKFSLSIHIIKEFAAKNNIDLNFHIKLKYIPNVSNEF